MSNNTPPVVLAAQSKTVLEAAHAYAKLGLSVIPLKGKIPALPAWAQPHATDLSTINTWHYSQQLQNVGIVCGEVSNNLVVLDMDGAAGYPAFEATFSQLTETYTVASGGGIGKHVYWFCENLPASIKAMSTPIGNLELCANGRQVVAPPSVHPTTCRVYQVARPLDILRVTNLDDLVAWIEAFKPKQHPPASVHPVSDVLHGDTKLNPQLLAALERHFISQGYKQSGDWLHGKCIYPARHKHGDRNASFGFNRSSGYGSCFVCGTILAKDICTVTGIHPEDYGGLMEKKHIASTDPVDLSAAPSADVPTISLPIKEVGRDNGNHGEEPPAGEFTLDHLPLPRLMQVYLEWAGAVGNETPLSFHCFSFFWLVATAVGRRLAAQTTWGQRIHANLYLMIIAPSTYYRKSTACNLARQLADAAFPFLLMPAPGSPERLLTSLAGQKPRNFEELPAEQQNEWLLARPFAAQRALHFDEVAGLLGALNRKEYMSGMKDQLLELYDCPSQMSRDTQNGLTIIKKPSLSILGVTTPAALGDAVVQGDWSNGLFSRFALITPEANYAERPTLTEPRAIPGELITGFRQLFDRLPLPIDSEGTETAPLIPEWDIEVQTWAEVRDYSQRLRHLCNPTLENPLDERLRPVYGRLHVGALKLALLCAGLRWLEGEAKKPVVTAADWQVAEHLAEYLRGSAHRLLEQLDRSGEANREMTLQDRVLRRCAEAGLAGCTVREMCRAFHTLSMTTREAAKELTKAGLLVEQQIGRTERYVLAKLLDQVSQPD